MVVLDLQIALLIALFLLAGLLYLLATAVAHQRARQSSPFALLQNSPNLLSQLDNAPYGLLLLDGRNHIHYQNQLAHNWLTPAAQQTLWPDLAAPDGRLHTLTLPNDQTISWWVCPLSEGALVVLADRTSQRQLEKSTQLFLSSLSHELRTPLTAILAHVEVLRTSDLPPAVHDNSLHQINRETNRIARLVQDLLTFSRLQSSSEPELRPIDLTLLVEAVISDIILIAEEKEIALSWQADGHIPPVLADADRLRQVLLNLLDNAVKYGRSGDQITICLHPHPQGIELRVQDSGPGIPAPDLPHVTEPLYRGRSHSPTSGSGLGLAIAAEIVRQHGSTLTIISHTKGEQTGTTVQFVLPVA